LWGAKTKKSNYVNEKIKYERKLQDCGNIQRPACTKVLKRQNGNDVPMAALTISGCDTFWEQTRTSAKCHEHSIEWICALYKRSVDQSMGNHYEFYLFSCLFLSCPYRWILCFDQVQR
jgi:hypothetical protein